MAVTEITGYISISENSMDLEINFSLFEASDLLTCGLALSPELTCTSSLGEGLQGAVWAEDGSHAVLTSKCLRETHIFQCFTVLSTEVFWQLSILSTEPAE